MTDDPLYLPARAKLNLVLRVLGRRDDGYHLLLTLLHTLELHDDLWVQRVDEGVQLTVGADRGDLMVAANADNLVARALQAVREAARFEGGFSAHLHKRIPHGGGLGGGSSDAAAALRLANALLPAPLDALELERIGSTLGADVPFFLSGGSQWGRGIGDDLTPAGVPSTHFVLIVPPFGCPTAEVYKNHASHWQSGAPQDTVPRVTGPDTGDSEVRSGFCNDLEQAAERVRPALGVLRRRIVALGHRGVRMTGSGSTLFLAFDSDTEAAACVEQLAVLQLDGVRIARTRSAANRLDEPVPKPRPPGRPRGSPGQR
jgi:4-diphosphocytidyl-2-C-methyl-D-erythritol kinase